MRPFIVLLLIALATGTCSAEDMKEEIIAMKRCREEAAGFFDFLFGMGEKTDRDGMTTIAKYKYHYNKQSNTCYMLTRVNYFNKQSVNTYSEELIDLNQKYSLGTYSDDLTTKELTSCTVGTTICDSKAEFEKLVRPYMTL